ncbi:MAG: ribose 5-phosphate isomerase B [Dehalococcoidia bacterium]|nr:MAG: ribose 5-phosphate isomerase B [Dehalococcoidia bacterium]
MKIALASDERTPLTDAVVEELTRRGHQVETWLPALGETLPWAEVGAWVGEQVASGRVDQGVLFCWTGTGVSMAANKVPGVRAALCSDAETARGARRWNDANVLVMSLRATSEPVAREILDAWFATPASEAPDDRANIARLETIGHQPATSR